MKLHLEISTQRRCDSASLCPRILLTSLHCWVANALFFNRFSPIFVQEEGPTISTASRPLWIGGIPKPWRAPERSTCCARKEAQSMWTKSRSHQKPKLQSRGLFNHIYRHRHLPRASQGSRQPESLETARVSAPLRAWDRRNHNCRSCCNHRG